MTSNILIQEGKKVSNTKLIWIHCKRILKRWKSNPSLLVMSFVFPIMSMVLVKFLFSGLIELFTGQEMNLANLSVAIGIMSMFTGAITGAGTIVQERRKGIMSRFASLPGPVYTSEAGRIMAESLRALLSALAALVTSLIFGANFVSLEIFLRTFLVLAIIAISVGFVAVMLGYATDTPQGAVSFAPLVMLIGFFNSAFMPIEMYSPALRPLAKYSPATIASNIIVDPNSKNLGLGLIYFFVLILISVIIISRKLKEMRA